MISNEYIINDEVIFNVNTNELQPLGDNGERVSLNMPTARCLHILLESNGRVISREEFLDTVWKARGVIVSQNTFYQNISLLRKSLSQAGLSQDIIVTVRHRGFVIASGVQIISCMSTDESEEPLNVQIIGNSSLSAPERKSDNHLPLQENVKEKIRGNKIAVLTLPGWLLILLVTVAAVNVFSLLWQVVISG